MFPGIEIILRGIIVCIDTSYFVLRMKRKKRREEKSALWAASTNPSQATALKLAGKGWRQSLTKFVGWHRPEDTSLVARDVLAKSSATHDQAGRLIDAFLMKPSKKDVALVKSE